MNDIKFSIVIPLYNKAQSIGNTLLSVLNQNYQNFEIVIVNDGSTDDSIEAVSTIEDDRIKIVHQKNQGVSAARNKGVEQSQYDWIAFLDGDDLWEANHLEEIIKMMADFPDEFIYVTSFEYSDKRFMYKHKREKEIFKIENYFKEAVREHLLWTSIVVINKLCLNEIGGFNTNLTRGEDIELWSRIAKSFNIIKSLKITAVYRIDSENRTGLTNNIEKTHVYYLPIKNTRNIYEKNYYKHILFTRLMSYLKRAELKSVYKLIVRYQFALLIEFLVYILKRFFLKNIKQAVI